MACEKCPDRQKYFDSGMEKILITGASGFLGKRLFDRLEGGRIDKGRFVRPISRSWTGRDVLKPSDMDVEMAKVAGGYVYHLASRVSFNKKDEKDVLDTNVDGTINVLRAARKYEIKKVVVVSSAITCGYTANPYVKITEKHTERYADNAYVASKKVQEALALEYGAVVVCPTTCRPIISGCIVPHGGTNVVSPDDIVEGMLMAMRFGKEKQKYILGGYNLTFEELYKAAGVKRPIVVPKIYKNFIKFGARFSNDPFVSPYTVEAAFGYKFYDCSKAKKELGWEAIIPLSKIVGR